MRRWKKKAPGNMRQFNVPESTSSALSDGVFVSKRLVNSDDTMHKDSQLLSLVYRLVLTISSAT